MSEALTQKAIADKGRMAYHTEDGASRDFRVNNGDSSHRQEISATTTASATTISVRKIYQVKPSNQSHGGCITLNAPTLRSKHQNRNW